MAGLSHEQVRLALNLERRFEDKPALKNLLVNGEASINKLARVVSIATPQNEEELAEKIKLLPQKAIEVLVKDEKMVAREKVELGQEHSVENRNDLLQPLFEDQGLRAQTAQPSSTNENLKIELSPDIIQKLNELHAKGMDVNKLLREILEKRETDIAKAKEEISENLPSTSSRYIPVRIRKVVKAEFGEKCSIKTCQKPSKVIHHTQRFTLSRSHDPHFLAPLCAEHHAIAHSADLRFQQIRGLALNTI